MNLGLRDSPTHVQRGQELHLVTIETNCHLTQDLPANIYFVAYSSMQFEHEGPSFIGE